MKWKPLPSTNNFEWSLVWVCYRFPVSIHRNSEIWVRLLRYYRELGGVNHSNVLIGFSFHTTRNHEWMLNQRLINIGNKAVPMRIRFFLVTVEIHRFYLEQVIDWQPANRWDILASPIPMSIIFETSDRQKVLSKEIRHTSAWTSKFYGTLQLKSAYFFPHWTVCCLKNISIEMWYFCGVRYKCEVRLN